jgi:ribosomal protein S18 acetylase RimI-like enzyme
MTTALAIELRPASAADEAFLRKVYASTREELALVDWSDEQKFAFLEMQFRAQDRHYRGHYANARFEVVLVDGEPAGRLYTERTDTRITVLDIALLPEHRGNGVGTALLVALQDQARVAGVPVVLSVETSNPAITLYNRLGFQPSGSAAGLHQEMTWSG